jgi:hypothetical protein
MPPGVTLECNYLLEWHHMMTLQDTHTATKIQRAGDLSYSKAMLMLPLLTQAWPRQPGSVW